MGGKNYTLRMPEAPQGQRRTRKQPSPLCPFTVRVPHRAPGVTAQPAPPQAAAGHQSFSAGFKITRPSTLMGGCQGCSSNSMNNGRDKGWKQTDILHPQIPRAQADTNTSPGRAVALGVGTVSCPQCTLDRTQHIPGRRENRGRGPGHVQSFRLRRCRYVSPMTIPLRFSMHP